MDTYKTKNIKLDVINRDVTIDEFYAIVFWLATILGFTIEVPASYYEVVKEIEDEAEELENTRDIN